MNLGLSLSLTTVRTPSGGGLAYSSSLTPPEIALAVGTETYPIELTADFPPLDGIASMYVRIRLRHTVTLAEVYTERVLIGSGNQTFPGLADILSGSHKIDERIETATHYGDWSNVLEHGPDIIAPELSGVTGTPTGTTSASIAVTTDEGNGTLYYVLSTSSTAPSKAQVKAGQIHTGAAAPFAGSQAVSSTGEKTDTASGLTSATTYYVHAMHEDAAANQSDVASSASFVTDTASPVTLHSTHAFDTQNIAFGNNTATFSAGSIGTAQTNRVCVACVVSYDGGTDTPSGVTIGGVAATRIGTQQGHMSMWRASVPTGTTADVVVTLPSNIGWCGCILHSIRTGSAAPSSTAIDTWAADGTNPSTAVTVPADGLALAFAAKDATGVTASWTNATAQGFKANTVWSLGTATASASATVTAGGFSGSNNGLIAASWGP